MKSLLQDGNLKLKDEYLEEKQKIIKEKNIYILEGNNEEDAKFQAFENTTELFVELFDIFSVSYSSLDTENKRNIISICIQNFIYDGEKLIIKPSPLFDLMINYENLSLVEAAGFEPASKSVN